MHMSSVPLALMEEVTRSSGHLNEVRIRDA
jgi:hypothetical protein